MASLLAGDVRLQNAFASIDGRNEQLATNGVRTQPAARNTLVRLLDAALQTPMSIDLPGRCWGINSDKCSLAKTLLEWCTSLYRPGLAKVYVCARILQSWSLLEMDVTNAVLDFMDADPLGESSRKVLLYHLVAELVRGGLFHVARYTKWLIARGGISKSEDVEQDGPAPARLLLELPTHCLVDALKGLRESMLRRARYSVEMEMQDIHMAIKKMRHALGLQLDVNDPLLAKKPMSIAKFTRLIRLSTRTLKAEIGMCLMNEFQQGEREMARDGKDIFEIAPTTFNNVRKILEATEDYSVFADILKTVVKSCNVDILGSVADTLGLHLMTFSALGVARDLFDVLYGKLKHLAEEQGIMARPLLASLASLAPRLSGLEELGSQLHKDLLRNDRTSAVDACSPVSDNMASRLQDAEGELHEEIEKLLSGGTSLDKNTLERLFGTVVERLMGCWNKEDGSLRTYGALLTKLRLFDSQHFDLVMTKWLQRVRVVGDRPSITEIYPVFVALECLSFPIILSTAADKMGAPAAGKAASASIVQNTWRTKYVQEVLQLLTTPISHSQLSDEDCYRFSITQVLVRKKHLPETLAIVRNALAEYSLCRQKNVPDLPLDKPECLERFLDLLRSLVLIDATAVAKALAIKNADPAVAALIEATTSKLLVPSSTNGQQITFDQVLELTNELTLPFCQLKLSSALAVEESTSSDANDKLQSHLNLFAKAMDRAIEAQNITWTGMLPVLGPEITQHLKSTAQTRLFAIMPSIKNPVPTERTTEQTVKMAENLLSVIDAVVRGTNQSSQLTSIMVDKLCDVWELLAYGEDEVKLAAMAYWLPLMLTFVTLHSATFDASKSSNEIRSRASLALVGIMHELDALPVYLNMASDNGPAIDRGLRQRVFDLALLLVDNLADESRAQCIRALSTLR